MERIATEYGTRNIAFIFVYRTYRLTGKRASGGFVRHCDNRGPQIDDGLSLYNPNPEKTRSCQTEDPISIKKKLSRNAKQDACCPHIRQQYIRQHVRQRHIKQQQYTSNDFSPNTTVIRRHHTLTNFPRRESAHLWTYPVCDDDNLFISNLNYKFCI